MTIYPIESTSAERIPVIVTTRSSPTASLPEFALTTTESQPDWDNAVDGQWDGMFNTTTGEISALSPLVGEGQDLPVTQGDYTLWIRWSVGDETPAELATKIRVS